MANNPFDEHDTENLNHESNHLMRNDHKDFDLLDEEFAEPLTPSRYERLDRDHDEQEVHFQATSIVGWISLILSFIALFSMPILFGVAGIILGFVARNRDAEWLGNIAIVLGIIAIITSLFIRPFI